MWVLQNLNELLLITAYTKQTHTKHTSSIYHIIINFLLQSSKKLHRRFKLLQKPHVILKK
jgi:hypothetical protein